MSSEMKQKEDKDGTRNYEQKTGAHVDKINKLWFDENTGG